MTDSQTQPDADYDYLVANNVRAELARERWTGRQAAVALGLTTTYVSRRLNGVTVMSPSDLKMFADLVGVPVARFFTEMQKAPGRGGPGASLPDLDSNQEPIG